MGIKTTPGASSATCWDAQNLLHPFSPRPSPSLNSAATRACPPPGSMRTALPLACLLLTSLLAQGYAHQCYTCFGINPGLCVGLVQTCANSDDVCMSTYSSRTIKGLVTSLEFIKMCGKSTYCKQGQTMTTPLYVMRQSTTCCSSDQCTPPTPELPPEIDTKENGVLCRSCYSDSYYCDTQENMKCKGSENKCARYSFTRTDKDSKVTQFALRGCASENICLVGSSALSFGGSTVKTDVACTDAGLRPEHGLLLPLLAGLVLLKLFS